MKSVWPIAGAAGLLLACLPLPASAQGEKEEPDAPAGYYWHDLRPQLDYHPIGMVLPKGKLRFSNLLRPHPAGFRADEMGSLFSPVYGLGDGWEITAGVTDAERVGRGGEALFYNAGVQKQLVTETRSRPAVSVGGYGIFGPHSFRGGTGFLAATKLLHGKQRSPFAVFLHGGVKFQGYESDDYGDGTGIRPYVGSVLAVNRRFFVSAEFSPNQPWAQDDMWALRGTYVVMIKGQTVGVTGGIRNVGYGSHSFIGISF